MCVGVKGARYRKIGKRDKLRIQIDIEEIKEECRKMVHTSSAKFMGYVVHRVTHSSTSTREIRKEQIDCS